MQPHYIELSEIIVKINSITKNPGTEVLRSRYYDKLQNHLNMIAKRLELSDKSVLIELELLFASTGSLQKISVDNGWAEEFLEISSQANRLIASLRDEDKAKAKAIFLEYGGSYFHMERDYVLDLYKGFEITRTEEKLWAKEYARELFSQSEGENIDSSFSRLTDIIIRFKDIEYFRHIIELARSKMNEVDSFTKLRMAEDILRIIEAFEKSGNPDIRLIINAKSLACDMLNKVIIEPITVNEYYKNLGYLTDTIEEENIKKRATKKIKAHGLRTTHYRGLRKLQYYYTLKKMNSSKPEGNKQGKVMKFDTNDDLKQFVKTLIRKMESIGEVELASELKKWDHDIFTTSSEFLGELKLILMKIQQQETLDLCVMKDVENCIKLINKAFGISALI